MLYSTINSPVVFFTGHTLAGASQLPEEQFEAFLDIISYPFLKGIKAIGFCGKVNKGLKGYNQFLKTKQYKMYNLQAKVGKKKQAKNSSRQENIILCIIELKNTGIM